MRASGFVMSAFAPFLEQGLVTLARLIIGGVIILPVRPKIDSQTQIASSVCTLLKQSISLRCAAKLIS
jgi:hypothetical protein